METRTLEHVKDDIYQLVPNDDETAALALVDEAYTLGAAQNREALTVAASGLAEILVAVEITKARLLDATGTEAAVVESIEHIREAVEALRASTQAAAEGR